MSPGGRTARRAALVAAAWAPARESPSHRAEMVTQWLCGEALEVRGREGCWLRCRDETGYVGWAPAGSLRELSRKRASEWSRGAVLWSWGSDLRPIDGRPEASADAPVPNRLPRGARARPTDGGAGVVELAGGGRARARDPDALLDPRRRAEAFPAEGGAVVRTAARWVGAPYLWGGRTEWGVDCSGLVQSVFAFHGARLPRDSALQRDAGPEIPLPPDPREALGPGSPDAPRPGDLLFFAPEGRGITHVAVASGGSRILHAAASNGQVEENDLLGDGGLERRLRDSLVARTRPLTGSSAGG